MAMFGAVVINHLRAPQSARALVVEPHRAVCRDHLQMARFLVIAEPASRRAAFSARLWNVEAMAADELDHICIQSATRIIGEISAVAQNEGRRFAGVPCAIEHRLHDFFLRDPEYLPSSSAESTERDQLLRGLRIALQWRSPRACAYYLNALRQAAPLDWLVNRPALATEESCRLEAEVATAYFTGAANIPDPAIAAAHAGLASDVRVAYQAMLTAARDRNLVECMVAAAVVSRGFRRFYGDLL